MLGVLESPARAERPRLVATLIAAADFAKRTRFIALRGTADVSTLRRSGDGGLPKLVKNFWGGQYGDLCYGYNSYGSMAFWRRLVPFITLDCDGFEVETLLNIRAARASLHIHEVPSVEHCRRHGRQPSHPSRRHSGPTDHLG